MHPDIRTSPAPDLPLEGSDVLDADLSIGIAAEALLACHARGADAQTILSMCERLLAVTERLMLDREERMRAAGDPNLADKVRRHGDVLFVLCEQVRASRRSAAPLPKPFVQFVNSLAERFRATRTEAA